MHLHNCRCFQEHLRMSKKKPRNYNRRALCHETRHIVTARGVICHLGVFDSSDRAHPLYHSHFARTEMFSAGGHHAKERQQTVNDFRCCIMYDPRAMLRLEPIIEVLVALIRNIVNDNVASPENERQQSVNRASTEHQQCINRASTEGQLSVNWASTEDLQSVNRASTERQQSVNRASTERQQSVNSASTERQQSVNRASTERQQSVNRVSTERQQSINTASTQRPHSINRVSTECQRFWVLHLVQSKGCAMEFTHNRSIGHLYGNIVQVDIAIPKNHCQQSLNRASTILGIASCIIQGLSYGIYP